MMNIRPAGFWRTMTRRRLMAVLVALLAAASFAPTSASAAELEIDYAINDGISPPFAYVCNAFVSQWYGSGCFEADGDWLRVSDDAIDGQRVAVYWSLYRTYPYRRGLCINKLGVIATSTDAGAWCNKNFPEDVPIEIYVGRCNKTASNPCTSWNNYTNWTGPDRATT